MELTTKIKDKVDASVLAHQKEVKLLASLRPPLGHSVFELNLETLEIKFAEFKSVSVPFKRDMFVREIRKELHVRPNCVYVSALNVKNAKRKFLYDLKMRLSGDTKS